MAGKGDEITYDKKDNPQESTITIDGVAYPAMAPTAFKQGKKQVTYPLLSIFFGWQYRDKASSEMIRAILTNKAVILLVTDKPTLIQYLQGLVEAADYIDQSLLRQGSVAAAAAEVGAAAETELPLSKIVENLFGNADNTELATTQLYSAIQAEIPQPGRDRRSVLQAPGRVRSAAAADEIIWMLLRASLCYGYRDSIALTIDCKSHRFHASANYTLCRTSATRCSATLWTKRLRSSRRPQRQRRRQPAKSAGATTASFLRPHRQQQRWSPSHLLTST